MSSYLQQHQQRKDHLITLLSRSKEFFLSIEEEKAASFDQFIHDIEHGDFSIVVVGEFSAGKSTFLNAVMGDRYLPSFTSETTATINFLKHTSKSLNGHTLQIDYKDPSIPSKFAEATKEEIAQNVSTIGGTHVVQDIESVTLYLDSPLLQQGITLVDSPGLNGVAEGHAEVTERQIERSHACIYMFAASQPGSKSDFEVLAKLSERFDNIFLVLNQIDKIKKTEESVESVVERLRENYLKLFPDHKMPEFYPIAAYPALVSRTKEQLEYPDNSGQVDHDETARVRFLEISRLEQFEQRLWKFITGGEKTIRELLAPAQMIEHELMKRQTFIKETLTSLENAKDTEEVNQNKVEVETDLEKIRRQLEEQKGSIQVEVKELVGDIENSVKSRAEALRQTYAAKVNTMNDLESLQSQISRLNRQLQADCEELIEELDQEFTSSIRKKINAKYHEIAVLANQQLVEADINPNTVRGLAFKVDTDISVNMDRYDDKTDEIEKRIDELRQKSQDVELKRLEARKLKKELEALEEKQEKIQQEEMLKMQMLGVRPRIERIEKTIFEEQNRKGALGFLGNILFGKETVDIPVVIEDDSSQKQYDAERNEIRKSIQAKQSKLDQQLDEIKSKNITDPSIFDLEMQQVRAEEERLQNEREKYLAEYSGKIQKENDRMLTNIRYEFEDFIDQAKKDILKIVRGNIKSKEEMITDVILSTLEQQFEVQVAEKQRELQRLVDIIESGEAEKADMRKQLIAEQDQLKEIAKEVIAFISEIESIQPDVIESITQQTA